MPDLNLKLQVDFSSGQWIKDNAMLNTACKIATQSG